jgi:hypothetical protein
MRMESTSIPEITLRRARSRRRAGMRRSGTRPRGLDVHPIAYGLAAFCLGASGSLNPAMLIGAPEGVDAYASRRASVEVHVTLINRNSGMAATALQLVVPMPEGYKGAEEMTVVAPKGDVAVTEGETLRGSSHCKTLFACQLPSKAAPIPRLKYALPLPARRSHTVAKETVFLMLYPETERFERGSK